MLNLITDRTQDDVDRVKKLAALGWGGMSSAQQAEWSAGMKGAYSHVDLNRVESAVAELAAAMGLALTTKTDWTALDVPKTADMERYLGNINALRAIVPGLPDTPDTPQSMRGLTWQMANDIEQILLDIEFALGTLNYSGELYCGEV